MLSATCRDLGFCIVNPFLLDLGYMFVKRSHLVLCKVCIHVIKADDETNKAEVEKVGMVMCGNLV